MRIPPLLALTALLVACASAPPPPPSPRAAIFDHHVHVLGPDLLRDWKSLGVSFSRPDSAYLSLEGWFATPVAGERAITGALLVPMAHLYGNAEFRGALGLSIEEERRRVQAENDHVAREAMHWPGVLAFASVDPLRPYALHELGRANARWGLAGIKLHLASAGVDLRDGEHLEALQRIAAWAEERHLWLLVHLDPQRRGTETADVLGFLEHVLGPHPDLGVVIAHLGGSGGFGPWTRDVLATLGTWLEREARRGYARPRLYVDLSAVPLIRASEGFPASTPAECTALAPALRSLGLERVLFGSDFPVFDPREHARFLEEACGFEAREIEALLARRLPD